MRKAIIKDGVVANIIVVGEGYEAPEGVSLADPGPGCVVGASFDGSTFTPPAPVAPEVPQSVTMAQAREALRRAGVLAGVDAAIAAIPDADQLQAAEIAWEYAPTVGRTGALVSMLGAQLGLTEDQIDDLFIAAAEISF